MKKLILKVVTTLALVVTTIFANSVVHAVYNVEFELHYEQCKSDRLAQGLEHDIHEEIHCAWNSSKLVTALGYLTLGGH